MRHERWCNNFGLVCFFYENSDTSKNSQITNWIEVEVASAYLTAGVMFSLPGHFQLSTGLSPSAQNLFDWTHKWMMKVIVQWICCIWKIDVSLLSSALSVYSSPPLSWWNRAVIERFHYSHHEEHACCFPLRPLGGALYYHLAGFGFLYVLDGNFPCSWLDACASRTWF